MKLKILILSIFLSLLLIAGTRAIEFYPVKYNFWTVDISTTVGRSIDLPVYVQNLGLLADNYTVSVVYIGTNPSLISIENALNHTKQLLTNQIDRTSAKLIVMSATTPITLRIYVMSDSDAAYNPSSTCINPSECSYLGGNVYCLSGKCVRFTDVIIKTGIASLSDFSWLGLLQIIFIASILALIKF